MSTITLQKKEIESLIRKSVRRVLAEEVMKLRASLVPEVSEKEQKEIDTLYDKPTRQRAPKRSKVIEI